MHIIFRARHSCILYHTGRYRPEVDIILIVFRVRHSHIPYRLAQTRGRYHACYRGEYFAHCKISLVTLYHTGRYRPEVDIVLATEVDTVHIIFRARHSCIIPYR